MARAVEKNPMKCPVCRAWIRVLETRNRSDNTKLRRYECGNLHRFSTRESIIEESPKKSSGGSMS